MPFCFVFVTVFTLKNIDANESSSCGTLHLLMSITSWRIWINFVKLNEVKFNILFKYTLNYQEISEALFVLRLSSSAKPK